MLNLDSTTNWDSASQRKFWNDWDTTYLQEAAIGPEALRRGQAAITLLQSLSLLKPNIIELGCGNGWLAERLISFGPVSGVDIADAAIEEASRRVPGGAFRAGDIMQMNLPAQAFDVAITLETFSHVPNQSSFAELIANILRDSGYLILSTQNRTVYMRRRGIHPPPEGQLRRWVTMRELRRILLPHFEIVKAFTMQPAGDSGFLRVVNSRKLNTLLSKAISRTSLEHLKEKCGLGQTLFVVAQKRRRAT